MRYPMNAKTKDRVICWGENEHKIFVYGIRQNSIVCLHGSFSGLLSAKVAILLAHANVVRLLMHSCVYTINRRTEHNPWCTHTLLLVLIWTCHSDSSTLWQTSASFTNSFCSYRRHWVGYISIFFGWLQMPNTVNKCTPLHPLLFTSAFNRHRHFFLSCKCRA